MDWQIAIDRNRDALIAIIVALLKSLGLVKGGALSSLPYQLYRKALLILRPAEAAVRRLIMMAAYDMELRGIKVQPSRSGAARALSPFPDAANFAPSFNLIDPLKALHRGTSDFAEFSHRFGLSVPARVPAAHLGARLLALKNALDTLQRQARRLNRWYAARDHALKQNQPHRFSPLCPGFPPGYRKRPTHPVEEVLLDCHALALYARERRDSS